MAAGIVDGAGDEAHEAHAAAAVDEADAAVHELLAQLHGGGLVSRLLPRAAPAEHAHAPEPR